jgi:outer membrane murein-binding lipoprotein Lpp
MFLMVIILVIAVALVSTGVMVYKNNQAKINSCITEVHAVTSDIKDVVNDTKKL